jgi:D-methionine transport system ATP-binding protein
MISLQGVEKIYPAAHSVIHALKGVSLTVAAGEIFGIIGRAGAGKSTLIRCVNLLERPSEGTIVVDNYPLTSIQGKGLKTFRRTIGMIFHHFNLLQSRNVFHNIALPLELVGTSNPDMQRIIHPLLNLVGLTDKAKAYPHQLSDGQKQRVAIARALVHGPKILLCDEATAALDPKTTHSILQLLRDINERFNTTILLMTDKMDVIKTICNKVAVLHQGDIVEQGAVTHLFANPISALAKEFVKSATRLELPTALRRKLRAHRSEDSNSVLRISFVGSAAQEALIAQVIQQYHLTLNIMQAHVETLRDETMGIMIAEVTGDPNDIHHATELLKNKGLYIEVLGYAPRAH